MSPNAIVFGKVISERATRSSVWFDTVSGKKGEEGSAQVAEEGVE